MYITSAILHKQPPVSPFAKGESGWRIILCQYSTTLAYGLRVYAWGIMLFVDFLDDKEYTILVHRITDESELTGL